MAENFLNNSKTFFLNFVPIESSSLAPQSKRTSMNPSSDIYSGIYEEVHEQRDQISHDYTIPGQDSFESSFESDEFSEQDYSGNRDPSWFPRSPSETLDVNNQKTNRASHIYNNLNQAARCRQGVYDYNNEYQRLSDDGIVNFLCVYTQLFIFSDT